MMHGCTDAYADEFVLCEFSSHPGPAKRPLDASLVGIGPIHVLFKGCLVDVFIFFLLSVQILHSVVSGLALHCLLKSFFFLTFKGCLAVRKPLSVASELAFYSLIQMCLCHDVYLTCLRDDKSYIRN